jgi:uncharacterized protein YjbI with pentapeptide repeats
MANEDQVAILRQGFEVWNTWRAENRTAKIDLSGAKLQQADLRRTDLSNAPLYDADLREANLEEADLRDANLRGADLRKANLRRAYLYGAYFWKANLGQANLAGANLMQANLYEADIRRANLFEAALSEAFVQDANLEQADLFCAILEDTNLRNANLHKADLSRANLSQADLSDANLSEADLRYSNLSQAALVGARVTQARISGSTVYGVNVWDLEGEFRDQKDLVITREGQPVITVDNIKVAQFIYLILNNEEIRDVINTLTSKSVLILGRFAPDERKDVLNALRDKLREYDLLPIVFDFDRPTDKDYTETVQTLAGLSLFVIVDVTNPKSTPLEMEATVKQFKIPYVPILDLQADKRPFSMMSDLEKSFHWVLPTIGYNSKRELLENVEPAIIRRALEKHNKLREQKAREQKVLTIQDLKRK